MSLSVRSVRSFGRAEDLDVPFAAVDRPALVTALLAQCTEGCDPHQWWRERVGVRIATLLGLAAATDRRQGLTTEQRCPQPGCGASLEITLSPDDLDPGPSIDRITVPLPDGHLATVRPPTGADQRTWGRRAYASRREAIAAITGTLVIDGRVSGDDEPALAAIATTLAEHDPLVDFMVSCVCPTCGETGEIAIDLEALALRRLAATRRALIEDVHAIAAAYGWTEREVLAIPPERRASYRALIDGMAG
jgi:hypothetical protein